MLPGMQAQGLEGGGFRRGHSIAHKTKGPTFCGAVAGVANAKDEAGPRGHPGILQGIRVRDSGRLPYVMALALVPREAP
jgi:hypothetical protein